MKSLRDKVVVVTGAASGIGRATANAFAREHAKLVLCDRDEDGLREVEREVAPHVDHIEWRRVDVSSRDEMKALADDLHARFGAVDVLVNNAGVGQSGGLLDTSLDDWDWVLRVNLWGVIHGCHFFVPKMVERVAARRRGADSEAGGHVVNVSSVFGFFAPPGSIGYATSKFGVFGLSESMRGELRPHGIGVSTICPGMINTNIVKTGRYSEKTAAQRDGVIKMFAERGHSPDVVAKAILSAVKRNRAVVPAAPEAWAAYYAKRIAPAQFDALARTVSERAGR
ncbi:MAG TPA: SDR family NAD(P)-dependent oxidoreductase [Polyangiaceae bacterium]|jgi:NAD(P)-dependent dehydrogenase (short-subunit alcohol dehydrogenase family)